MSQIHQILQRKGRDVVTITPNESVLDAARLMNESHIGALVVTSGDRVLGIITERDVMNRVVTQQRDPAETLVADVMTSPVAVCTPETTAAECRRTMKHRRIRHLPVAVDEHLVGMVSIGDVIEENHFEALETIHYLYEYMAAR